MDLNLNTYYIDILKEIGNIGSGNAATALSKMVNDKIDMKVPVIEIIKAEEIVEILGAQDMFVIGIYVNFYGDIQGTVLLIIDKHSADIIIEDLLGKRDSEEEYNELELSAIQEIGNILTSAYVNSISALSNLDIVISVPSVSIDMAGAILSVPAIEYSMISEEVILIENKILKGEDEMNVNFFLLPDIDSFKILFRSLGVYLDE